MRAKTFVSLFAISIAFLVGSADRPGAQPPKAKTKVLMEQKLDGIPGFKVIIVLVDGPPGWVGGRHFHPGHIFGYVLEGTYQINPEGFNSRTYQQGETFSERPNTVMHAKNGSETKPHKNIVFQIVREGKPASVSVK